MYVKSVSKSHKIESELWITQVHWSQVIYRFEKSHISQTSTRLLTLFLTHSMERKISLQGSTLLSNFTIPTQTVTLSTIMTTKSSKMKTKPRLETWTSLDPNKNRSYLVFETEVFFLQKKETKWFIIMFFFIIQMKDFYFSDSINQEIIWLYWKTNGLLYHITGSK